MGTLAVGTKTLHIKCVPKSQSHREKSTVILYTCRDIDTKPRSLYLKRNTMSLDKHYISSKSSELQSYTVCSIYKVHCCYFNIENLQVIDDVKYCKLTTGP